MKNELFLRKSYWLKYLGINNNRVPGCFILYGSWFFDKAINYLEEIIDEQIKTSLPNLFLGKIKGRKIMYGAAYGSTMAGEMVHIAGSIGIKKIIFIGSYISLEKNKNSITIPDIIINYDNVLSWYKKNNKFKNDNIKLKEYFKKNKINYNTGKIATISFMLMENKKILKNYKNKKISGLDLELATVYGISKFFKSNCFPILIKSETYTGGKIIYTKKSDSRVVKKTLLKHLPKIVEL